MAPELNFDMEKIFRSVMVVFYIGILFFVSLHIRMHSSELVLPIWDLQNSENILRILIKTFFIVSGVTLLFIPLGTIISFILNKLNKPESICKIGFNATISLLLGFAGSTAVTAFGLKLTISKLTPLHLLLQSIGIVLGIITGTTLMLRTNRFWIYVIKFVVIAGLITLPLLSMFLLCFEAKPLPFQPSGYDSNDKRILIERIRHKDPRKFIVGQHQTIMFTWNEINKLFAWGLDIGSGEKKAKIYFNRGVVTLLASVRLPVTDKISPYVNIELKGNAAYDRSIWVEIEKLRIGHVAIPVVAFDPFYRSAYTILKNDHFIQPLYDAIEHFELSDSGFCVQYGKVDVPDRFGSQLMSKLGASSPLASIIYGYLDQLIVMGRKSPSITMKDCMETVFQHAEKCAIESRNPVDENQAAVFALAILIGYERIGKLVGPVTLDDYPVSVVDKFGTVSINGRTDWARHFLVSAALQLLSNIATSDAVGLLKEELDGDVKGSGFSFADYLADRAGTTFGAFAVKDSLTATTLQARISEEFIISDYFPEAADLPENMYDEEFISVYGGVGGQKYGEIMETIERRIGRCPAYRK
ncbi:MAG: hypothetical protein JXB48_22320 [Candidatus Latescibacteria bacterium]|nr:hypothetical protein [Candidatus Latescibacterota bacterium]